MLDHADAFFFLQFCDLLVERFHFGPMHFRPEMVLGMIAIVKKEPVVNLPVAAHPPSNGFIGVRPIMAVIAIQITKTVPKIEKRQKIENHVAPVKHKHHEQHSRESCQLDVSPYQFAAAAFAQFPPNRTNIVAEETRKTYLHGLSASPSCPCL